MKRQLAKIYFKMVSQIYRSTNDNKLTYFFKKKKTNDTLVVIFSAFPRIGMPATYNYMKTLKTITSDQLFILDDFGNEKLGAYYLFENGSNDLEIAVTEFLKKILFFKNYKKIIFVGTSKGGYAAAYYGLKLNVDAVISGAQQYLLGNYLTDIPEKQATWHGMVGDSKTLTVEYLNELLPNLIKNKKSPDIKFYIHYSSKEHTYQEHISFLLDDLKNHGYNVVENREEYVKHQEVAKYFPKFLYQTLQEYTEKNIEERLKNE
ncbi:Two component regulator three Y domain-containing protein [Listeria rocourtiae]|uniref:Two component regulator three Y domain-containing protein n=1 Tax=Listeria rocourtiae TaxID=647910 RepID=UPI00162621E1|nr:Two component regulator three Y domain-containing protein [Listeria rocourtiae]MBC1605346.1 Two component regulator three Y domain-containing protein [Listeria rocourtiae]